MQVTIIGSGNVATVLGRVLVNKGNKVDKVYSRDLHHAEILANELGAEAINDLQEADGSADLYLVAVTDDALAEIAARLSLKNKLVVHTAGSVSKEILKNASNNYGVLWPMKMIRKQMTTLEPVSIVVDGSSAETIIQIENLARLFSPNISRADDAQRAKMHMLAALTSNFANHLYQLASDYCAAEGIDFSVFYPIIEETALGLHQAAPSNLQAGPAFRGDRQTIQKHLALLQAYPQISRVYEMMSKSIAESFPEKKHASTPEKPR
ncbi:MAG: DUF2520 domain-containing protein [Bacteroidota bacterium]